MTHESERQQGLGSEVGLRGVSTSRAGRREPNLSWVGLGVWGDSPGGPQRGPPAGRSGCVHLGGLRKGQTRDAGPGRAAQRETLLVQNKSHVKRGIQVLSQF